MTPKRLAKVSAAIRIAGVNRRAKRFFTRPLVRTSAAILGYAASYTPSLLPRPWYFQGLIAGIGAMGGYQSAVVGSAVLNQIARLSGLKVNINPSLKMVGRIGASAIAIAGVVAVPLLSIKWQRRAAKLVNQKGPDVKWALGSAAAASAVFWLLLGQYRAIMAMINYLTRHFNQKYSWRLAARLSATAITLATILVILDQVILRGVVGVATTASAAVDLRTPPNVEQPQTPLHSGSPWSLEPWDTLGLQGKRFTCAGARAERIASVMGVSGMQPIRAYASLNGRSIEENVDAVLAELDRMSAWERKNFLVVTTTGRGNVNEWAASAFEYLTLGDCAIIAMQYSGLPSAVTMVSSKQVPVHASRLLFEAIEARIAKLPVEGRPKLFVNGESLGAFGSNGIFDSPADMMARCAGGLWTGCPNFTPILRQLLASRDPGSSSVEPVIDNGRHFRFAADPSASVPGGESWQEPRFLYLQNVTDPVVYWTPRLLWERPDWVDDAPTGSTMAAMRYFPFTTFWQISADMPVCRFVEAGYGHKYHARQTVPGWVRVLGLDENADYSKLIEVLEEEIPPVAP